MHSSRLRPCSPRWLHIHIPVCWRGAEPQAEETFALPRLPTAKRPGKNGIFYTLSWILKQIPLQGLKDIRVHPSGRTPPALRYSMRSAPSQWWRGKHPLTEVLMLCSCKGGSASPGIAETYSSSSAALTRFVFSHLFLSCELEKFGGLLIFSCLLCVLFSSSHCLFITDLNHMITSFLFFSLKKKKSKKSLQVTIKKTAFHPQLFLFLFFPTLLFPAFYPGSLPLSSSFRVPFPLLPCSLLLQ